MKEIELDVKCFNLKYTLECGQCFRWNKIDENTYIGVVKDRVLKVRQEGNKIFIKSDKEENLEKVVRYYFDLDRDYEKLEKKIVLIDDNIAKAVKNTSGLRNLNQDFFEMLISYIISANNNIPRISKSVNEISKRYGKEIEFEGQKYYLFPTPDELRDVTIDEFRECGVGFRDKYIYKTVEKINNKEIDLEQMQKLDTEKLKAALLSLMGVGPKVADCILLFSCARQEVFPIDVWVQRIMRRLYYNNEEVSKNEILRYARENFGENAGIIQQHLFYNVRENMI